MKLPLYHGKRTNKTVRKVCMIHGDRDLLSTRYSNCEKCEGKGEVIFASSAKSKVSFTASNGDVIYEEQLCKDCDEFSRKLCKTCCGNGFTDFINCDACFSTGLNPETKSLNALNYRVDNRRKVNKENNGYQCFDCGTRICKNVVWHKLAKQRLNKEVDFSDYYDYS
jgi:hypothetical protein